MINHITTLNFSVYYISIKFIFNFIIIIVNLIF